MFISLMQKICYPIFGSFEKEEFKKFLRMGLTFAAIIGAYWTLRTLKNATFGSLVGASYLPFAKTASLIFLFPLVMIYTKLLDKFSREKMFYVLSFTYAIATIFFAVLLLQPSIGQAAKEIIATRSGLAFWGTQFLAYAWYIFVESYGSLVIALFWAIASDTTKPESAKNGFYFITAIGQVGGIVGPYLITRIPGYFGFTTNALAIGVTALVVLASILFFRNFLKATPPQLLASFHGRNEAAEEKEQEPGFFEGLVLLIKHWYLLGIFAVLSFFEIIVTIFDLHFQTLAASHYSGTQLAEYIGLYGSSVNLVTLICLLLGISNITRLLGIGVSLALMPIIIGLAVFGFISFSSLNFLFALMVGSKAINYALNGPAIKQLYIPTTHDVRFKAQAWMEVFGSRGAKEAGSIFNMLLVPLQNQLGVVAGRARHVMLSSYLGFGIVIAWFFIALYLGRTYKKAIDSKTVVC